MKCLNCHNELVTGNSFCEFCGTPVSQKKMKVGIVTIICFAIFIILLSTFVVKFWGAPSYYSSEAAAFDSFSALFVLFLSIPYYCFLFIVSLCFDLVGLNKAIKNGIIIAFIILPAIVILFIAAFFITYL